MRRGARNARGNFFWGVPPNSWVRQVGKVFPTITTHPRNFFMPQDEPRRHGKPGER